MNTNPAKLSALLVHDSPKKGAAASTASRLKIDKRCKNCHRVMEVSVYSTSNMCALCDQKQK
jgi:hypothetical protein